MMVVFGTIFVRENLVWLMEPPIGIRRAQRSLKISRDDSKIIMDRALPFMERSIQEGIPFLV